MVNSNVNALGVIFANTYDNLVPELVAERSMASIPFGGRYRLIDFTLSSMANAGIDNVSVIVRKNYHSLMDHLGAGREWDLTHKRGGLNIVPPFAERSVKMYSGRALVQGWADLSANFTLAIENLNLNITNIFNKKFPDQSTPETAEPSPSPSPSPSPEPSPSPTPDPGETPTPIPAPTDKPSDGNTNNFWNFVFPGGNDDGTENGHKGILWALISLLIAVVTFVLGLGSAYSYVFPFLPAGLVTTIHICVLVLLLFAIIKFVRSFL